MDVRLEAKVAVGENPDEAAFLAAVLGDRNTGDPVVLHQVERFVDAIGWGERDRVDDHPALRPLDAIDFGRLFVNLKVLVNDAEAAELRHRDSEAGLGDRVHGSAQDRDVEPDVPREPRGHVHLRRLHRRMLRHEQHVIERERRGDRRVRLFGAGEWGSLQIHGVPLNAQKADNRRPLFSHAACPWHFLYFFPLPHGHGSLRPTLGSSRLTVLITSSPPVRAGVGVCAVAAA